MAATWPVDRHLGCGPCSTEIRSWLTGSSLTLIPTSVTFSLSAGDSIVSAVIPDLRSVIDLQAGPIPDRGLVAQLVLAPTLSLKA